MNNRPAFIRTTLTFLLTIYLSTSGISAQDAAPAAPGAPTEAAFTLTVIHVGDTHLMFEPVQTKLNITLEGEEAETSGMAELGGFSRTLTAIKALRERAVHPLVLHAGDFCERKNNAATSYTVEKDAALWNSIGLDGAAIGNNDMNPAWRSKVAFPLLAANIKNEKAWTVKKYGTETVGIIGLTSGPPADAVPAVQKAIDELTALGINKIVLVSHLGIDGDIKLAAALRGLDVIAGGHSHSLLGSWRVVGRGNHAPYPAVTRDADNNKTLIVHTGEFGQFVGDIQIRFTEDGRVAGWIPAQVAVLGDAWYRLDGVAGAADGDTVRVQYRRGADGFTAEVFENVAYRPAAGEEAARFLRVLETLRRTLAKNPALFLAEENPQARAIIEGR